MRSRSRKLISTLLALTLALGLLSAAASAETGETWGYEGRSTPYESFLLRNILSGKEIGTFCLQADTYGLSRDSYYVLTNAQDIETMLGLSADAIAGIRHAVAMMRTMYVGSAFSLENAINRFPTETLSRMMGVTLTQDLVWYREHLDDPDKFIRTENMKSRPFTAAEQAFFYGAGNNGPLDIGDSYGLTISEPASPVADADRLVGPFKIDHTAGSSASLININGDVRFSLDKSDPAYLVIKNGGTAEVVQEVSLGQEFYLKPRALGQFDVTLIPKSTVITEVVEEYIFFNSGFQGQYGLTFDVFEDGLKATIEFETGPGEELPDPDITKEVKRNGVSDDQYAKEITVPENSNGLFRVTIDTFDDGGIDLLFSPMNDAERLAADVIEIYTPEQFYAIRNDLDGKYKLMNNIDMKNYIATRTALGFFEPIGSSATPFTGSFDGGGYTIAGVKIDTVSSYSAGLFAYTGATAEIKNLVVEGFDIQGGDNVGAVIGYNNGGSFSNLHGENIKISAANHIGGLVGFSNNAQTVSDCSGSNIEISSVTGGKFSHVGGLFGTVTGSLTNCLIDRLTVDVASASTPDIPFIPFGHGGIVGVVGNGTASVTVSNCIANNITFTHADTVGGTHFITGGIVGYGAASSTGQTTVEYCSVSNMKFNGYGTLGGILGVSRYRHALSKCVVNDAVIDSKKGTFSITDPFFGVGIGGITSGHYLTPTTVESCAVNNITITAEMTCIHSSFGYGRAAALIGGISGRVGSNSSFKNCYTSGTINVFTIQYWISGSGSPAVSGIVASGTGVENCISEISIYDTTSFAGDAYMTISGIGGGAKNSVAANPVLSLPAMLLKPVTPASSYPLEAINRNGIKRVGGSNNNIAMEEMVLYPSVGTPIYTSDGKFPTTGPEPTPNAIYTLAATLNGLDGLSVSLSDLYLPQTYTTAYNLNFDLESIWLPPSDGVLPRLRNTGPADPAAVGSGLSAADGSGVWARGARTYYVIDEYDGNTLTPDNLLDSDGSTSLPVGDTGTAVITIPPQGSYSFYYLTPALPQGEYVNNVSLVGVADDIAKINVTEPKDEAFYVSVAKYATSILTPLADGWEFGLYKDGDLIGTLTGASQSIRLTEPGEYILQEISKPDGYTLDNTEYKFVFAGSEFILDQEASYENGSFAISAAEGETRLLLRAVNIREDIDDAGKTAGIRVVKRDSVTNTLIADNVMVFKLYDDSGDEVAVLNASNGFTAEDLEDGRYTLTEITPPAGYDPPANGSVTFVIGEGIILLPVAVPNDMYAFDPLSDADNIFSITALNEGDGPVNGSLIVRKTFADPSQSIAVTFNVTTGSGPVDLTAEGIELVASGGGVYSPTDLANGRFTLTHDTQVRISGLVSGLVYTVTEMVPGGFNAPSVAGGTPVTNGASAEASADSPPVIVFTNSRTNTTLPEISPSPSPSGEPSPSPSPSPENSPSAQPSDSPSAQPSDNPSATPTTSTTPVIPTPTPTPTAPLPSEPVEVIPETPNPPLIPDPPTPGDENIYSPPGSGGRVIVVIGDEGTPLGQWTLGDDYVWVFDEEVPLANMPRTGDSFDPAMLILYGTISLVGIGLLVIRSNKRKRRG